MTKVILQVVGRMCRSEVIEQDHFRVLRKLHEKDFLHNVINVIVSRSHPTAR